MLQESNEDQKLDEWNVGKMEGWVKAIRFYVSTQNSIIPIFQYSIIPLDFKFYGKEGFHVAEYQFEEKVSFDGKKVKVLGPSYEEGKPETPINWRQKLRNRDEMLAYLKTGERYWFSDEWFGSEKRKTKA